MLYLLPRLKFRTDKETGRVDASWEVEGHFPGLVCPVYKDREIHTQKKGRMMRNISFCVGDRMITECLVLGVSYMVLLVWIST